MLKKSITMDVKKSITMDITGSKHNQSLMQIYKQIVILIKLEIVDFTSIVFTSIGKLT